MKISRIQIENFRNFSALDVVVDGNVVIVGENRVGKSNLLFALRLVLDPTLPDSARQLSRSDFWDGLSRIDKNTRIRIALEIADFENDEDVLCTLTDYRTVADATKARLTYEYRSNAKLAGEPKSDDDYEFVCFGGEKETQRFGHDLRRRLPMDWLPALRDAEGDLGSWRRSPLRPLIDDATRGIDADTLAAISNLIQEATGKLIEEDALKDLEAGIGRQFADMSGTRQDVKPRLGFNPTEPASLYRTIRLLIDEGKRGISDASLGSANLMYLTLKLLELKRYIDENRRDHTLLSVEEPEAHLHPHLQRSVYRHLFSSVLSSTAISVLLTTHSPHIVSVAPLSSIVLLKDQPGKGTTGVSAASINLTEEESH